VTLFLRRPESPPTNLSYEAFRFRFEINPSSRINNAFFATWPTSGGPVSLQIRSSFPLGSHADPEWGEHPRIFRQSDFFLRPKNFLTGSAWYNPEISAFTCFPFIALVLTFFVKAVSRQPRLPLGLHQRYDKSFIGTQLARPVSYCEPKFFSLSPRCFM